MFSTTTPARNFERLSRRYTGTVAQQYDARRAGTAKWEAEQTLVERLLRALPTGAAVLDIPVGTGRFLPVYRSLGFQATGMDVSADMLARARAKCAHASLRVSDIRRIDAPDAEFDCAVCVRFLNWVDAAALSAAIRELARVSRQHVILGVRHYAPLSGLSLRNRVKQRLGRWQTARDGRIVVHSYRVVQGAFRDAGLTVGSVHLVESSGDTDYCIYQLTKP